jgi:hypothetical protein
LIRGTEVIEERKVGRQFIGSREESQGSLGKPF